MELGSAWLIFLAFLSLIRREPLHAAQLAEAFLHLRLVLVLLFHKCDVLLKFFLESRQLIQILLHEDLVSLEGVELLLQLLVFVGHCCRRYVIGCRVATRSILARLALAASDEAGTAVECARNSST